MKITETLNTIGMYCPMPIILATQHMKKLNIDDIIEIICDDEDTLRDIPNWCKKTGQQFLKIEEENGVYKFYIKKVVEESE